jgi:hypothetical protein
MAALYLMGLLMLVAALSVACGSPQQALPWQAAFDDAEGWILSSDAVADVAITDGMLRIEIYQPGQLAWATSERTWRDFRAHVEATQMAGPLDNEYGILVRMDDDRAFYAFSVSGDGYVRAARFEEGAWSVLGQDWTPSSAINQGEATNALEVVADGSQFVFRVNGESVIQVDDESLETGALGLYAGAFAESGVVVAFDHLDVAPLDP